MPRRKPGTLLPLETEILEVALSMLRSGHRTFHGFGLARTMREQSGSRSLTAHGTLYKALSRLEEFGFLTSRWEDAAAVDGRPRRRLYALTGQGVRVAEQALTAKANGRWTSPTDRLGARMTPERAAALVARWVRLYTRDLPIPIAQRRVDEIGADLHDHIAHERANGISDRRIAFGIASRMVRGLAADAAWRGRHAKAAAPPSTLEEAMKTSKTLYRSAVRVALGVAFILSLPLVAMLITDDVVWSLADFAVAGVLLAAIGVSLELAARKAGNLAAALGIAAVGVAAAMFGEADDAPGLVLLGILLIVSACALGVRTAQRSR